MDIKDIYNNLDEREKDALYRMLWIDYVKDDVKATLIDYKYKDLNLDKEKIVDNAAHRYVYDGHYDCTISYWDNIYALIDEEIESATKELKKETKKDKSEIDR